MFVLNPTMRTTEEKARKLIADGYAEQCARIANDCSAWLFWHCPWGDNDHLILNGGTVFFIDAGTGPFGVTASHVVRGLLTDKQQHRDLGVQLGNIPFDPSDRLLGEDLVGDIATFRIQQDAIALIGKRPHISPDPWPPRRPQENKGAFFGGYRVAINRLITPSESVPYDFWYGFGPVTGVFNDQFTMRFERQNWESQPTVLPPPQGADWGGTSGGPMFALFENSAVSFRLAGVIKEYWAAGELMAFAPIDRIREDGATNE